MTPSKTHAMTRLDAFLLVAANLLTIYLFAVGNESLLQVVWIYWVQNVIIGIIHFWRIINTNTGFPIGNLPGFPIGVRVPKPIKFIGAGFFAVHYGFFHLIYAVFLISFGSENTTFIFNDQPVDNPDLGQVSLAAVLLSAAVFALHHGLSFYIERRAAKEQVNTQAELNSKPSPYARILPIHLIILFAVPITLYFGQLWLFVAFMILKTIVDLSLHYRRTSHPW